jgi:choline dehydrogenase
VRQSAYDAYLKPVLDRPNLTVVTDALVRKVVIDDGRARGVFYTADGVTQQANCAGEVILTAGVFGSPQLLMLSGVGPAGHLRKLGIEPVADLPGVGENLQDHPFCGVVFTTDESVMGTHNHSEVAVKLRSRDGLRSPDVELLLVDVPYSSNPNVPANGFTIMSALIGPVSRGNVRLASTDPADPPLIDPRYLSAPEDWEAMLHGMAKATELGTSKALAALVTEGTTPSVDGHDREAARAYVRENIATYCHSSGTCRMGTDALSVVDPELRVHGIEQLRVVDASVMPRLPAANSNVTVLAVAERAADLLLASRKASNVL